MVRGTVWLRQLAGDPRLGAQSQGGGHLLKLVLADPRTRPTVESELSKSLNILVEPDGSDCG